VPKAAASLLPVSAELWILVPIPRQFSTVALAVAQVLYGADRRLPQSASISYDECESAAGNLLELFNGTSM